MDAEIKRLVTDEVHAKIRDILCDRGALIQGKDDLISDLEIISDDLSLMFIPDLEDRFGIRGTQDEWYKVHTVGDSIDLLTRLYVAKCGDKLP